MNIKKLGFAIAVIALLAFACGCVDSPQPTQVLTPTLIPQPERDDNAIFVTLVEEMGNDVSRYLNDLGTNIVDRDYVEAHTSATRLESLVRVYIEDIRECVVMEDTKPAQILILKALEETRLGAIDCQAGLGTSVDICELEKGQAHFKMAVGYLEAIQEIGI